MLNTRQLSSSSWLYIYIYIYIYICLILPDMFDNIFICYDTDCVPNMTVYLKEFTISKTLCRYEFELSVTWIHIWRTGALIGHTFSVVGGHSLGNFSREESSELQFTEVPLVTWLIIWYGLYSLSFWPDDNIKSISDGILVWSIMPWRNSYHFEMDAI